MTTETEKDHAWFVRVKTSPLTNEDKQVHPDVISEHQVTAPNVRTAKAIALEEAVKWNQVRDIKMTSTVLTTYDYGEKW